MLKNKAKIIVTLFTIITLVSAFCITVKATEDTPVVTSETETTTEQNTEENTADSTEETLTNEEENNVEETENEILSKDLYLFDETVTFDKIVDGNVYIFGNNVKITGKVNGNLIVFGNNVEFATPYDKDDTEHANDNYCYVAGSVYVAANKLTFNGIAKDLYIACNKFDMVYDAYIMRDIRIVASEITLKGYIARDAYLVSNNIDFGTPSENEEDNEMALIAGDLHYTASAEIEIPEKVVTGETKYAEVKSIEIEESEDSNIVVTYLMNLISTLIFTIVMYLIISWLAPKFFEKSAELLKTSALPTVGIGFLTLIVVPIVGIILLCLTLFSLSLTLIGVYALMIAISFTLIAGTLTDLFKDKFGFEDKKLLLVIIISIILWALQQIPVLGGLITFAIMLFGLGLIVKNIFCKKTLELKEQN